MANSIPVIPNIQFLDANGDPLAGGKLYTYESGTVTPQATYTDKAGTTPNANPIILDANGRATIWIDNSLTYTFKLDDANDVNQFTANNISSTSAVLGSISGALLVANDLSDLNSVATALVNLGIKPLSVATTTAITASMGATSISGYSFTPGNWVKVEYYVTRNSDAILGTGEIHLHYDATAAAWRLIDGPFYYLSGKAGSSGLTFTMSGNQLQVAADASGNGSLITKYHSA